jgi:hypothetical protein
MMNTKLPAPRLQLRWAEAEPNPRGYQWACHYELVISLDEFDIRREIYDKKGKCTKGPREVAIPMKPPTLRGSDSTPCTSSDGKTRYCDDPFRDGAHARWDATQLGDPPIFVIAPDGMVFPVEYDPEELRAARAEKVKASRAKG